jgi:hypothetical protein
MPLCDKHLSTASAVGLSVHRLALADDVREALLDTYGLEGLSLLDATTTRSHGA